MFLWSSVSFYCTSQVTSHLLFCRYGYEKICPSNPHGASTLWIRTTDCVDQSISHPSTDRCDDERNARLSPSKRLASPRMNVDETPLNFQAPPNSNNDDTGFSPSEQLKEHACIDHSSTREDSSFCHPQLGYIPLPIPMGAIPYQTLCAGHHSILQPVFHHDNSLSGHGSRTIGKLLFAIYSGQSGWHEKLSNDNSPFVMILSCWRKWSSLLFSNQIWYGCRRAHSSIMHSCGSIQSNW